MEIPKTVKSEATPESQSSHISKLPDEIIREILEKLPLEETMKTGSLSQRWRNQWKYRTNIKIGPSWEESTGKAIVPSVDHIISLHMGEKIKEFSVKFMYLPIMSAHVDSWIQFATDKKVENLEIDLDVNYGERRSTTRNMPSYVLNPCLFDCDSLVLLDLRCCRMALPASVSLKNLKEMHLHQMELENTTVYALTSNTPVLAVLSIDDCNSQSDLHVNVAPNSHFRRLSIHDGLKINPQTQMHVRAPAAKEFLFDGGPVPRTSYNVCVSRQCTKVALHLDSFFVWCVQMVMQGDGAAFAVEAQGENSYLISNWATREMEPKFLHLLSCFRKAESLVISNWGVQMLSIIERRNIRGLPFSCKYLKLYTNFKKWELPGICFMLKACKEVEEVILASPPEDQEPTHLYWVHSDIDEGLYFDRMKSILKLPKLKTLVLKKHNDLVAEEEEIAYEIMLLMSAVAENLRRYVIYRSTKRFDLHMGQTDGHSDDCSSCSSYCSYSSCSSSDSDLDE